MEKVQKQTNKQTNKQNYLPEEEEREGGEKKAHTVSPWGGGARTQDLPRARRESPAARHGHC